VDDDPIETVGSNEPSSSRRRHPTLGVVPVASPRRAPERGSGTSFTIDCGECAHQSSPICEDCVVSFIVDRSPGDAVVIDAGEARAVRLLEQAGLVPASRHRRRVG
jgi:hypothetical protein